VVKLAIQIALISLGTCALALVLSVLFGTRNIPMVGVGAKPDIVAGFDLLVLMIGDPSFGLGLLAPVALPMFAASVVSSIASVAVVMRRARR
jgi:hypothetical protein